MAGPKGNPVGEDDLLSSLDSGGNGNLLSSGGNIASTINSQFGVDLNIDTKDFNTEHAEDAVDFEDISLTEESDVGDDNDVVASSNNADTASGAVRPNQIPLWLPTPQNDIGGIGSNIFGNDNTGTFESLGDSGNMFGSPRDKVFDTNVFGSNVSSEAYAEMLKREEALKKAQQQEALEAARKKEETDQKLLKYYYPLFSKDSTNLKMHTIFKLRPNPKAYLTFFNSHAFKHRTNKPLLPTRTEFVVDGDAKKAFARKRKHSEIEEPGNWHIIKIQDSDLDFLKRDYQNEVQVEIDDQKKDLLLATTDWDDDAIINREKPAKITEITHGIDADKLYDFEEVVPDETTVLEGKLDATSTGLKLDMNDPKLFFTDAEMLSAARKGRNSSKIISNERSLLSRFDVSNDVDYDLLQNNYHTKIRATLGNLTIDHTMPALRLQYPYYKVKLTKQQTRQFHRPKFIVRSNTVMYFSKPKLRKRKRDKGKDVKESFASTSDLTLGDTVPFYLFEYSEQQPLILSNFGMGSKIINYYRKRTEDDSYRPKGLIGETHVLGTSDKSPFWNFGFVEKGTFVPTLYNQMARAPVFQHDSDSTDFLLVKSSGKYRQSVKYYLRSISKVFVVGQEYPVVEVPGPHSRKVTTVSKNRLKMIVYRVLNHSKKQRLAVKDISAHFPDQNDMQNRQRLKEFMVYQRTGEDHGFWKIKPNEKLPTEEEIRAMISPEDICLLESMQVGQQHLEDYSVYSYDNINLDKYISFLQRFNNKNDPSHAFASADSPVSSAPEKSDDKDDLKGEALEEQLAPWNSTRNFINATQGKAMLQLHGEGEPTGIKEGISFLRTSMKGGFKSTETANGGINGHSYNVAIQQKAYDDEIRRTWDRQSKALSSDEPRVYDDENKKPKSRYYSRPKKMAPKVLRITRMVKNQFDVFERKVEVIKDERIINAYLLRKQEQYEDLLSSQSKDISQSLMDLSNVKIPKNEDEKKMLLQELEKLEAQKNSTKSPQSGKGIGKGKNTKRKCALCGAVGHIRTKKSCPMYGKLFPQGEQEESPGNE